MQFARFISTPTDLGVGTQNFALLRQLAVPAQSSYSTRDVPRRVLGPIEGAHTYYGQRVSVNDIAGFGGAIPGTFRLQPLANRS